MMIIAKCPRPLSICMAASSYSKPVIGYCAKKINVIPVYRPEDGKVLGKGTVQVISPTEIKGIDTKFLTDTKSFELGLGSLLIDKKYSVTVLKIESETKIKIKENKEVFDSISKEIETEHSFFYIPKMDNSEMFKAAYKVLHEGGAVCIFPEGTSHDRTDFLKLKAGVALMALGALAKNPKQKIKVVSAGLTYFKREEFRSEVIVEFGQPFEVPTEWGELYQTNKKEAIDKTLKEIESQMKAVTITAPSYLEYSCLCQVRDLYIPDDVKLPPNEYFELCKRFSRGYREVKDDKETKSLKRKVVRYIDELENAGLDDAEVKEISFSYRFFLAKTITSFVLFHVYLLLSMPMICITAPFFWIVKKKAERERIAAKAKNPNKIQALDVVSSVRITNFLKYIPCVYFLWILYMHLFINKYLVRFTGGSVCFSTIFYFSSVIFPFYSYLCTLMVDRLFFYLDTMKMRFLFFCYPKNVRKIKETRSKLEKVVLNFINSHARQLGYINSRIINPGIETDKLKERNSRSRNRTEKVFKEEMEYFWQKFNLN